MADGVDPRQTVEEIPADDVIYIRVLGTAVDQYGKPEPGFFRHSTGSTSMSCDWCRHCPDAEATRHGSKTNSHLCYGVVKLSVGGIRSVGVELPLENHDSIRQDVLHSPIPENVAHSDLTGPKSAPEIIERHPSVENKRMAQPYATAIRDSLRELSRWVINPPGHDDLVAREQG